MCQENHQIGGKHYYFALRLSSPKRWKSLREIISSNEGIVVSVSNDYYSAHK